MLKIYISLHWRKMLSSPCLELSTMQRILKPCRYTFDSNQLHRLFSRLTQPDLTEHCVGPRTGLDTSEKKIFCRSLGATPNEPVDARQYVLNINIFVVQVQILGFQILVSTKPMKII